MEIIIQLEDASWLDEVMFGGQGRRTLDLPGGATLRLAGVQRVQSAPEQIIAQFVLENVLTPVACSLAANFLYEKFRQHRDKVGSATVPAKHRDGKKSKARQHTDLSGALPEEIEVVIRQEIIIKAG
jgi:hypothetical protein